ncbi:hypothetical protein LTR60_003383, partial [Cryomyces antarcticus]
MTSQQKATRAKRAANRNVVRTLLPNRLGRRVPFPFLKLPAELRNLVYRFVLVFQERIAFHHEHATAMAQSSQPPLTKVSRQIRAESLPVFYGGNWFECGRFFASFLNLLGWFKAIGNHNCALIRHVVFDDTILPEALWKAGLYLREDAVTCEVLQQCYRPYVRLAAEYRTARLFLIGFGAIKERRSMNLAN